MSLNLEGSVQQRNIEKDTAIYNLSIANINYGAKYHWKYSGKNNNNAVVSVGVMINHIFINKNSTDNFDILFNNQYKNLNTYELPHLITGISGIASLQLNNSLIYFRTYSDITSAADLAFNIGIKVTGQFFSF